MNALSRSLRPRIAVRKKTVRAKARPRVGEGDLRDSMALNAAINIRNAGRRGRMRMSNVDLAKFASPLGGSKYGQVWGDYRKGYRHIPARDKLIAALYLERDPGSIFPSFREFSLWDMLRLVLQHASAAEQSLFSELVGQFATVTSAQREAMLARLKNL